MPWLLGLCVPGFEGTFPSRSSQWEKRLPEHKKAVWFLSCG